MFQSYPHYQTDKQKLSPEKVTDYVYAKDTTLLKYSSYKTTSRWAF